VEYNLGIAGDSACIGWDATYSDCGPGAWSQSEYDNIIAVINQHVTQDGQLKSSTVGNWLATWFIGTTAVPDRSFYAALFQ
jgi:hypothetical protein